MQHKGSIPELLLICSENLLTSLDLSKNTALLRLFCNNNHLTSLGLSSLTALNLLYCGGNQLSSLDISNNTSLGSESYYYINYCLSITNMPSLQKVCVWTMPFPPASISIDKSGSPNVYFTNQCSK
jgi:hypothetical protein